MTSSMPPQSNDAALLRIERVVAGGGSSNMRNRGTPRPLVVASAHGCYVDDVEGHRLIDLNMGYGPHLYGYGDEVVAGAIYEQLRSCPMTGLPHLLEAEAAELICALVPSVDQVRFANSGTEAVASALRLARLVTGRQQILTFEGHYHGWSETVWRGDSRLPDGQLRAAPGAIPRALGCTLEVPWNAPAALEAAFENHGQDIAGVIVEPVSANCGVRPPAPGFLEKIRELTARHGALLVFDEVITGFRLGAGGAQELFGVLPDVTVVSKVMGAGFPVAAFGGSASVMEPLASNLALHAGVYAGNHLAMRAVVTRLRRIQDDVGTYGELAASSEHVVQNLAALASGRALSVDVRAAGSIVEMAVVGPSGSDRHGDPSDARRVTEFEWEAHRLLQMYCQEHGVYFHPDPRVPWFLSTVHSRDVIDTALDVIRAGLDHVPSIIDHAGGVMQEATV
jgi:glutamate-1-semialdehyde 2,1-aminomutase